MGELGVVAGVEAIAGVLEAEQQRRQRCAEVARRVAGVDAQAIDEDPVRRVDLRLRQRVVARLAARVGLWIFTDRLAASLRVGSLSLVQGLAGARADSYGFPGVSVDGNDPIAVYEATQAARRRALAGDGPTLIEAKTYRFRGHYEGDPQVYREPGEMAAWRQRDPVPAFRARLLESGLFDEAQLVEMETAVQTELDVAVAFAAAAPLPVVDEALQGIYAETHEGLVF